MARLDAQTSQIQQYQEMETNSCIEKSDLREELKQARETITALEAKVALTVSAEDPPGPSTRNIIPFAAFEGKLSPQLEASPYDDPAEFAMLLESPEVCAPASSAEEKAPSYHLEKTETVTGTQKEQLSENANETFNIPEDLDQPQFTKKRKAVNFEVTRPDDSAVEAGSSRRDPSPGPAGQEERPSKTSRHVHKWTYSRIRTTSTEIQQEQSTGPVAGAMTRRRASPKGLVSASSASHAAGRANTRSRGKRRSRGRIALPASISLNHSDGTAQASAIMHVSTRKADPEESQNRFIIIHAEHSLSISRYNRKETDIINSNPQYYLHITDNLGASQISHLIMFLSHQVPAASRHLPCSL